MTGRRQPNPAQVERIAGDLMVMVPCCVTSVLLGRDTTDLTQAHRVTCPLCELPWTASLSGDARWGLRVSWRPAP
ncbi:MAG: hypothetical protein ACRDZO_25335 [Egibacteraceae bacterium]